MTPLPDRNRRFRSSRRSTMGASDRSSTATMAISSTAPAAIVARTRSEEHTSELQSHVKLVCRLRLEKKKERMLVSILLLQFLILMVGGVVVVMLPLLVWSTPDFCVNRWGERFGRSAACGLVWRSPLE